MVARGIRKTSVLTEYKFDSRDAASTALAARMAGLVRAQLARDGEANFVVGGGTTPGRAFDCMSEYELEWDKVQVALSDERWVPNDHEDSNERLVRNSMLKNAASAGGILPVYEADTSVEERVIALQSHKPKNGFACSMVGMGSDGHFASLFPDSDCLEAGLKLDNASFYIPVRTSASPHPRVSMTLSALLASDEILLFFYGKEKLAVFDNAHTVDRTYPITALLEQQETPVCLYWAP
jgi:6-phosphogluconolactonase